MQPDNFTLRKEILREHSKAQCAKIVAWVANRQDRFDELFNLFVHDEYRVVQRAAWPLSYCVMAHPEFINHHFGLLVKNLEKTAIHDAVKRNTLRLLVEVSVPKKFEGAIMNICFTLVSAPKEPAAIKAFALTLLGKMARTYPEIIPEIKLIIEEPAATQTAAFKVRARRLMQEFGIVDSQ